MTPSQFYTAVQNGQFILQNGYYVYRGDDADASLYLTKAEGDALLSRYENGAQHKEAVTLAQPNTGPVKTGLFGVVGKYVEKISQTSTPKTPLEDYEIFQSVDPTSKYGQDIVARKIKVHQWARKHKQELSDEQKRDVALLANTAVDEVDYAGPKLLTEILRTADTVTREAVLGFTTAVLKGELSGQVNTVSEQGKGAWAEVGYQFLKSESQTVDPKVAESSFRVIIGYYAAHPEIAEAQGIDIKELLTHPLATTSSSDVSGVDNASRTMGMAALTGETVEKAPLVDPVALTSATLKQQNADRVGHAASPAEASGTQSVAMDDVTAPLSSQITLETTLPLSAEAVPLPLAIVSSSIPYQPGVDGHEAVRLGSFVPFLEGLALFFPNESLATDPTVGPDSKSGDAVLAPHLDRHIELPRYSAQAVLPAPSAQQMASEIVPATRSKEMRSDSPAGFDIMAVLEGAFEAFVAPSERSDATTRSQDLADDSVLTGLAGAQAAVLASLAHYGRGLTVVVGAGTRSHSHVGVERTDQQANGGDHQGNNREGHEGHEQGQSQQEGQRQPWYEPGKESERSAEAA